jgi:hypothetical protein
MDFVANLLSFTMSTHTHDFGNQNNGYGHLMIANARSSADCRKTESSMVWTSAPLQTVVRLVTLKLTIKFI